MDLSFVLKQRQSRDHILKPAAVAERLRKPMD
jgi:hypothetical protein